MQAAKSSAVWLSVSSEDRLRMITDPMTVGSSFLASPEALRTAMSALELDAYLTGLIVTRKRRRSCPSE
jgi:hypothetical protein